MHILLCVFATVFVGRIIIYILTPCERDFEFSRLETIGLSYLFGIGAISLEMFIMGFLGIQYTPFNILIVWFLIASIATLTKRKKRVYEKRLSFLRLNMAEYLLIFLISFQSLYNFFRALIKPVESYDAVGIYGLKAKMLFLAGGISGNFFKELAAFFHGAHPDYPLLIPLSQTWVYTFLGRFDDLAVKVIFPLFYISFLLVFYGALKRITKNRILALLFTFLLASVKQFSDYSTIAVADMELGIYFAVSIFYFYHWILGRYKKGSEFYLSISLLGLLLALWTKNEGMLLSLITLCILIIYVFLQDLKLKGQNASLKKIAQPIMYVLITSLFMLGWVVFKRRHGLINENFNLSMVNIENFFDGFSKIPAIIYEYQKQFFGFKKWNIVWILFAVIFIKEFKYIFSGNIKYISFSFVLFCAGYVLMYIFSAVEINFFVRFTGSRFLLHILPLVLFWMAVLAHERRLIGL